MLDLLPRDLRTIGASLPTPTSPMTRVPVLSTGGGGPCLSLPYRSVALEVTS